MGGLLSDLGPIEMANDSFLEGEFSFHSMSQFSSVIAKLSMNIIEIPPKESNRFRNW